jgi:hypothetical protein
VTAAEDLAAGLLAGIGQADPDLAVTLDGPDLRAVCDQLAHLLWTPLMLERWGSHPRWCGVRAAAVLADLRALGLPPEAPRSAVPLPQDVCPEHLVAGDCPACAATRTAGPPPGWRARAGHQASEIDLFEPEGANL